MFTPKQEEQPVTVEPPQTVTTLATQQQGKGLRWDGYGMYRAGTPMYGLGIPVHEITTVLQVLFKLLIKDYNAITEDELYTLFKSIIELERKHLIPKKLPERIKDDIKKQKGGFIQFLAPLLAGIAGPLIGNLLGGQGGSGIRRLLQHSGACGSLPSAPLWLLPLSNFDIIDYYKTNKHFGGIFSRDSDVKYDKNKFYIINSDTKEGLGCINEKHVLF